MKHLLTYAIIFSLVCFAVGCATPGERLLSKVNDDVNYATPHKFGECRTAAEEKVKILNDMGIKAEVVHCKSRSRYEWGHAIAKAYIDGKWYALDNLDPVVLEYNDAYKKAVYDYIIP